MNLLSTTDGKLVVVSDIYLRYILNLDHKVVGFYVYQYIFDLPRDGSDIYVSCSNMSKIQNLINQLKLLAQTLLHKVTRYNHNEMQICLNKEINLKIVFQNPDSINMAVFHTLNIECLAITSHGLCSAHEEIQLPKLMQSFSRQKLAIAICHPDLLSGKSYQLQSRIIKECIGCLDTSSRWTIEYDDLWREAFGTLRIVKWVKAQDNTNELCCICQSEYEDRQNVVQLSCQHYMHTQCLCGLMDNMDRTRNRSCPLCNKCLFIHDNNQMKNTSDVYTLVRIQIPESDTIVGSNTTVGNPVGTITLVNVTHDGI
jgi:hypothetical protein